MKKLFTVLAILFVLAAVVLLIFVETFDAGRYRVQIAQELSNKTGRQISLKGPIKMILSWKGATLGIEDAAIGNPTGASHPVMASIGHFDLAVSLVELMQNRLAITGLKISDAVIDLETLKDGRKSWDMTPPGGRQAQAAADARNPGKPVSVHMDKLAIDGSRVTIYDATGKSSVFVISHLTIDNQKGAALHLEAEYNGAPVTLNVQAGTDDMLEPKGTWPFSADGTYENYRLNAEGKINLDTHKADITKYDIKTGGSDIGGKLEADWAAAVPSLRGTLVSDNLASSDFSSAPEKGKATAAEQVALAPHTRVFSDEPLGLDGLKGVNAAFNVRIGDLVLPSATLQDMDATIRLEGGFLAIDPFTAKLGKGTINSKLRIAGATSPYQASIMLTASNIALDDLLHAASTPSFISGNSDLTLNVATSGDTPHMMANNALGVFNLIGSRGNISSSLTSDISSVLMALFAPTGSNDLNCLAARFIIRNGIAQDNGILVDTGAATIAGKGNVNLGQENLSILLHARAKSASFTGQLLPAAYVSGTFSEPHFSVDPNEVVQNVANLVLNGSSGSGPVPDMQTAPAGQNACVYTLEHPAPSTNGVTQPGVINQATQAIQNIAGSLKGMMGH